MVYVRRSGERGNVNLGWLKSRHTFSFGHYYDASHMGMSVLRVINDDIVQSGRGFDTHGHRDMEIISYVIEGALRHKDNQGNDYVIPAGDIQVMSAGTGITHSEYNASDSNPVRFLQIWIKPQKRGLAPGYQQLTLTSDGNSLTPLVTPTGYNSSLQINQDASIYRVLLAASQSVSLAMRGRQGYLHIIEGEIDVFGLQSPLSLAQGDGLGVSGGQSLQIKARSTVEALWFDLPPDKQQE